MITGETLIKGLFYFMLKAKGGKYLSRKQVAGKDGKLKWVYKYAKKKGEKSKASPEKPIKQSKPKADSKNMKDNPKKDKGNVFSSLSKDELSEFTSTDKKMKQSETSDKIKAAGKQLESLHKEYSKLSSVVSPKDSERLSSTEVDRLIKNSKTGNLDKEDSKRLNQILKKIPSTIKYMQGQLDKAKSKLSPEQLTKFNEAYDK